VAWLAAAAGFIVGSVLTWAIYLPSTVKSECDGPCFEEWHPLLPLSVGVGLTFAARRRPPIHGRQLTRLGRVAVTLVNPVGVGRCPGMSPEVGTYEDATAGR